MKKVSLLLLLLSLYTCLLGQDRQDFKTSEISVGAEYAIPIGDFRKNNSAYGITDAGYNYGIGGSIKYLYRLNKRFGVALQGGAIRYHSDKSSLVASGRSMSFTSIPVKLGGQVRYRSFFAEPQVGLTYFTDNNTWYQNASTTYGLHLGSYLSQRIALSGNYERWNRGGFAASHLGVRVAYHFYPGRVGLTDSTKKDRVLPAYKIHPEYDKNGLYWQRHKTFKTLGWVSIGVGVPVTLLGLVTAIASVETNSIHPSTYKWLLGTGAALSASSVPFFVLSHKYKKMARRTPL